MKNNNFVVFIISHGRPDNIKTLTSLRRANYTGEYRIVIDNEDGQINPYFSKHAEKIIVFDKKKIAATVDNGDNFDNHRTTTHARNACFEIAKELGYTYFLVLDDDYTDFRYKYDHEYNYVGIKWPKNIDKIFDITLDYFISTPQIKSIAFSQGGDFFGGGESAGLPKLKRKCMNSFFCSTERPFKFFSRLNEDVNTYITLGSRGELFLTLTNFALQQVPTQINKGGMSDAYANSGTYVKSFYSVMYCPSFMKIYQMSSKNKRIHHLTDWASAVPVIISETHKKYGTI